MAYTNDDGSELVGGQLPTGVGQSLQLDSSGNLKVTGSITASNPSVSADGSPIPADSTLIGGSDGTNLQPLQVDGSNNLKVVEKNSAAILTDFAELLLDADNLAIIAGAITSAIMQTNIAKINNQTPTLDNTTIIAVSNRGKNSVAGDTPIACDASGNMFVNLTNTTGTPVLGSVTLRQAGSNLSPSNPAFAWAGGTSNTAIAAGTAGDTVIKASAGRCCYILVTTLGTNGMLVWDNASGHTGTIIAALAASAPAGLYGPFFPSAAGVTVQGNAANPAVTINWG